MLRKLLIKWLDDIGKRVMTLGKERTWPDLKDMTDIGKMTVLDSDNQASLGFYISGNKVLVSGYPWMWFRHQDSYVTVVSIDDFRKMMERFNKETRR